MDDIHNNERPRFVVIQDTSEGTYFLTQGNTFSPFESEAVTLMENAAKEHVRYWAEYWQDHPLPPDLEIYDTRFVGL